MKKATCVCEKNHDADWRLLLRTKPYHWLNKREAIMRALFRLGIHSVNILAEQPASNWTTFYTKTTCIAFSPLYLYKSISPSSPRISPHDDDRDIWKSANYEKRSEKNKNQTAVHVYRDQPWFFQTARFYEKIEYLTHDCDHDDDDDEKDS